MKSLFACGLLRPINIRYVSAMQLLFVIRRSLILAKPIKTCVQKRLDSHLQVLLTTPHLIIKPNQEGLCIPLRNQQTCTFDNHTTKLKEVRFSI